MLADSCKISVVATKSHEHEFTSPLVCLLRFLPPALDESSEFEVALKVRDCQLIECPFP